MDLTDMLLNAQFLSIVIIIMLIYVIWRLRQQSQERLVPIEGGFVGDGLGHTVYTSGATMRRLAQKFSDASQAPYLIIHNAELPAHDRNSDLVVLAKPVSGVGNIPAQGY